jgi:hypothetical protein
MGHEEIAREYLKAMHLNIGMENCTASFDNSTRKEI